MTLHQKLSLVFDPNQASARQLIALIGQTQSAHRKQPRVARVVAVCDTWPDSASVRGTARQLILCNAVHFGSARLARWLLQAADRTGSERLALTQEFLSEMLALGRSRVTLLAQELHRRGAINYSRGKITIVDRKTLQTCACEWYHIIRELYRNVPRLESLSP